MQCARRGAPVSWLLRANRLGRLRPMRVSTRGDYASRALLSLALRDDLATPVSVRDLAQRTGLPQPYLEQILLSLKSVGLVRSKRGVGGGYVLARSAESITLAEIVAAVDGPIVAGDFGEPHKDGACNHEGQCVLLGVWADVGNHMREHLSSFTLADMVDQARGGQKVKKTHSA
jgi:Rrf2 family protein